MQNASATSRNNTRKRFQVDTSTMSECHSKCLVNKKISTGSSTLLKAKSIKRVDVLEQPRASYRPRECVECTSCHVRRMRHVVLLMVRLTFLTSTNNTSIQTNQLAPTSNQQKRAWFVESTTVKNGAKHKHMLAAHRFISAVSTKNLTKALRTVLPHAESGSEMEMSKGHGWKSETNFRGN